MKLESFLKLNLVVSLTVFIAACSKDNSNQANTTNPAGNIKQTPTITSLNADTGNYNSVIIITGTHFDPTASGDRVFFNGSQATISAASATQLTVNVPLSAGTGKITLSVDNGNKVQGPVFTYKYAYFVTTIAGSNLSGEVNGTGAAAILGMSTGICTDSIGNVYIADEELIRKVTPAGVVTSYVGQALYNPANNGTLAAPNLGILNAVTIDPSGNMFITDAIANIWKVTPAGVVSKFGNYSNFGYLGIASDAAGNIYVADAYDNVVKKISPSGVETTFAGSGQEGSANGAGPVASFELPNGVAVDNKGNVYVTDIGNTRVRKITPTGVVSNLGPADFIDPKSLTVDAAGNVYVADVGEALVKKITPSGDISLIAGIPGTGGTYTLDGIATVAVLYGPLAITVDKKNNLYISDGNDVRRINYE